MNIHPIENYNFKSLLSCYLFKTYLSLVYVYVSVPGCRGTMCIYLFYPQRSEVGVWSTGKQVTGGYCLSPAGLSGPWLKEGVWIEEKIDERLKIKSEGHSSEYWIHFMFISNSLFIHQSRKEGKGERLFLTQIQRTQKVVTFLVSETSSKHTLGQNILFLWPSRNNNTLKLSDLRSRWSQATLMDGRRL